MISPFPILCLVLLQSTPTLRLEDALRLASSNSPRIKSIRLEGASAQNQTDREKPVARPIVTIQGVGSVQGPGLSFPQTFTGERMVVPNLSGRVEINVEQTLLRAGGSAAKDRYRSLTEANRLDLVRSERQALLEVQRAYFMAVGATAQGKIATDGVELARKQLKLTIDLVASGLVPERDIKASEADLAEAELGASRARNGEALAQANLNRLMGRDPSTPIDLRRPDSVIPVPSSFEGDLKLALARRPEILQLEVAIKAALAGVKLAKSQELPTVSARATAAAQNPLAIQNSTYVGASLVFQWNLFDNGKIRADQREAKLRAAQLEILLDEAKLGVRLDVEKAWRDMKDALARLEFADKQIAAAEQALSISEQRYASKVALLLEVSGARLQLDRAKSNRSQALIDLHAAHADYAYSTVSPTPVSATR